MTEKDKLNFEHLPSKRPNITLTKQQNDAILEKLPTLQHIIHYMFWSKARYNGREGYILLSILTGNMIIVFKEKNFRPKSSKADTTNDDQNDKNNNDSINKQDYNFDIECLSRLNLLELNRIAYDSETKTALINGPNEEYCIGDKKSVANIQYLKDDKEYNLTFLQCIFRNYSINFSVLQGKYLIKVNCDKAENFPPIDIPLSPSQNFQFLYYAKCINKTEYIHQVVQYIHSLVLLGMPIVDVSKFPLISQTNQDILKPIFEALSYQKFVCGICCTHPLPDLMESIQYVFNKSSNINLLHLENCNMHKGMELLNSCINKKKGSNISYWNLRGNPFEDIKFFIHILKKTKSTDLLFLDLSYCNIKEKYIIELYKTLARFPSLQHLYMAGSMNSDSIIEEFDNLLTQYENSGSINLSTLDLSEIENISKYLSVLNKHNVPLRSLKILGVKLNYEASKELKKFIKNSSTLRSLDLTNLDCEESTYLENILKDLNNNDKLHHFDLYMDSLKLNSGNWSPIFKAFLSGNDLETKWNLLSLNSNNMKLFDLENLIPLLSMMDIRALSLNDNFSSEMEQIDKSLIKLIEECNNLKKLHLKGGEQNKLGDKVIELLKPIANSIITEIDFSDNNAGEDIYPKLQQLIEQRNNSKGNDSFVPISSISIDGNGLSSVTPLEKLIETIKDKNVIKFDFPEKDCQAILDACEPNNKKECRNNISRAKVDLVQTININRARESRMPDLPFKATKEMVSLVKKMTKKMRQKISNKDIKHSLFCRDLGLPLPYQDQNADTRSKEESIPELEGLCETYHSKYINKYIEEPKIIEPDVNFKSDTESDYSDIQSDSDEPIIEKGETEDSSKKVKFHLGDENNEDENKENENDNDQNKEDENDDQKEGENGENDDKKEDENDQNKEDENKEDENKEDEKHKEEEENSEDDKKKKKKHKKEEEEEYDDEENDKKRRKKKRKRSKRHRYDDEEDEEDDEDYDDYGKHRKRRRNRKHSHRKNESDSDSEENHRKSRRSRKHSHRDEDEYDEDDDEDEEDDRRKDRKRRRRKSSRNYENDDSYGDESDENHRRSRRKSKRSRHDESEYDDDEEDRRKDRKRRRKSSSRNHRNDDSEDDELDENYTKSGNRKKRSSRHSKAEENDDYDDENNEEQQFKQRRKNNNNKSRRNLEEEEDNEEQQSKQRRRNVNNKQRRNLEEEEDVNEEDINERDIRRRKKQQNDSEFEDERPSSAARNKSEKNKLKQKKSDDYDSDDNQPIIMSRGGIKDEQERKADEDMDNFLTNTSQNLGTFKIKLAKTQKAPGRRRPPPTSLNNSQRRQKSNA